MVAKTRPTDDTDSLIYQGATQTQLLRMFESNHPRIKNAISKVTPVGMRGSSPIFKISEIAPHIVNPVVTAEEMERFLINSDHKALPNALRKEFWIAKRAQQDYQLKAGDLWPTTKVIEHVGALIKLINMSMRLMTDTVERQVELSERQRHIIKEQCDAMLLDLQEAMKEHFAKPEGIDIPIRSVEQMVADYDDDEI